MEWDAIGLLAPATAGGGALGIGWAVKMFAADYSEFKAELKGRVGALEKTVVNLMSREEVQTAARVLAIELETRRTAIDARLSDMDKTLPTKDDLRDLAAQSERSMTAMETRLMAAISRNGHAKP